MSVQTRSPLRITGATLNSGFPATGEQAFTRGGQVTAGLYSGNVVSGLAASIAAPGAVLGGADVLLFSGAGRLNTIIMQQTGGGTAVPIYDGSVPTSGGPFVLSGHKILGTIPASPGLLTPISGGLPGPIPVDAPFLSGLIVAFRSGMLSCSITYTPETNQLIG